ncbi:sporulation histidine kinase inhibitor Sda [Virgibacillus sediminis]|uniref:Sporulation histidine kinase inhibitor Sda n=1 Tax=Virgibacillus sediminis TaxID=202260 RepID=A0ABV7A8F8_9BACI
MKHLSDGLLMEAYKKATTMQLADDFIRYLEMELAKRRLLNRVKNTNSNR